MNEDASQIIRLRNEFYRDSYKKVMAALLLMILINVILLGLIYYLLTNRPSPQYFAVTATGKILKPTVLSQPVYDDNFIRNWAANVSAAVYSYDFVHYRKQLEKVSDKFTPNGWRAYLNALKGSRNLDMVLAKHLTVSAVPTGSPVILDQGVVDNKFYAWKVQLPLLVTYQSGTESIPQSLVVTMNIFRVSVLNSPEGIGIDSFVESTSG